MSLADLAKKAAEHKGKGGQKAKDGAKPDRKPGITKENYQFDYSVNVKNIETFTLAKRFLTNEIGETYGEHSTIIESGAHFMMFAPDTPQPAELEDPVNGEIVRMQYKTEYANYIRKKADYDAKCIQVWHFIYAKCTIAMKNALKQYNNWTVINNTKDALALWLAIVDISVNGTDTAEPSAKRVMEALHRFDRLHQKTTESVAEFYDRFNENYDAMVAQGAKLYNVTIPEGIDPEAEAEARVEANEREELMKAMGFLNKLDRTRFKGMIDDLVNSSHRGRDEYPKTLIAAFIMASNYKENGLRVDGVMHAKEIHGVGFVTKPSARSPAHERSVPSRPTDNKRACYICGDTNHFQKNCPMKEKVVKYLAKASKEEKDEVKKTIGLVTLSSLHEEYALMEKGNVTFDDLDLGLDNESGISLFRYKWLLTNLREVKHSMVVHGINKGSITTNIVGDFFGVKGVYWHPDAAANILCFYDVNKLYGVKFDGYRFTTFLSDAGIKLVFNPMHKMYICKLNPAWFDLTKAGEPENSNHAYTVVSPSNHVTNSNVMCLDQESLNNNCTDSRNVISESTKMVTRDDDLFLLGAADIISTQPQPDEGVKLPDFGNDHCLMIANDDTKENSIGNCWNFLVCYSLTGTSK